MQQVRLLDGVQLLVLVLVLVLEQQLVPDGVQLLVLVLVLGRLRKRLA